MTRLVVLGAAPAGTEVEGYDLQIGPLRFTCPLDPLGESLGDGLEAVGAALVPAERRPRPLRLKVPVRAYHRELDPTAVGLRLRRQTRQMLENPRWRMGGLFAYWSPDPDLDGWLLIGGGELSETDPGISFGDFELELSDVYMVGRPGTHKPARRLDIADRRGGQVPRDTRGFLYSTDFNTQALPTEPLAIPGDVVYPLGANNRVPASITAGAQKGTRRLWRTVVASNGEAVSYAPDTVLVPSGRRAYQDVEDVGSVRCWDLSTAAVYPPVTGGYARIRDDAPDAYYGWERVFGDVLTADKPLALDNGVCRVVWLGPQATQGLALEYHDASIDAMRRAGTLLHAVGVNEIFVVELTPERGVLEFRASAWAMRVILQRGWWGPRVESYADTGGTAAIEYGGFGWGPDIGSGVGVASPTWVRSLQGTGSLLYAAIGRATDAWSSTTQVVPSGRRQSGTRTVVAQLGFAAGLTSQQVASLSLADARPSPVLVARARG